MLDRLARVITQQVRLGEPRMELLKRLPRRKNRVVLVHCPEREFDQRSTRDCEKCPFFYGFQRIKGSTEARVVCGYPLGRSTVQVEI